MLSSFLGSFMLASLPFTFAFRSGELHCTTSFEELNHQSHANLSFTQRPYNICSSKYCQGIQYNSANGEDKFVDDSFFRGYEGGFFIEMGAWDGLRKSNSLSFEKFYNWKGMLIEGNPINFRKVLENRQRGSINVEAIVCQEGKSINFAGKENTGHIIGAVGAGSKSCIPLQHILDKHNVTHVDFFSLDVEGAEMDVLKTIDFLKVTISVFMVETHKRFRGEAHVVNAFLRQHGFRHVECPKEYKCKKGANANIFFIHKHFVQPCNWGGSRSAL